MQTFNLIDNIARCNNGVITKCELEKVGISKKSIETLISKKAILKVGKGIYVVPGQRSTWLQRASIQTKLYANSLLSHESVLHLYDILDPEYDLRKYHRPPQYSRHLIHIINPHSSYKNSEVNFHKTSKLLETDFGNSHLGIKHVSLEHAIIDCSSQLNSNELSYVIEKSLRMRLTSLGRIANALETLGPAKGRNIKRIVEIIDRISPLLSSAAIESYFETIVENTIRPLSKYELVRQYKPQIHGSNMRLDFAIVELKIAIEADGYDHHGTRAGFDKDKFRYALLQSNGWLVLSITTTMSKSTVRKLFLAMQSQGMLKLA